MLISRKKYKELKKQLEFQNQTIRDISYKLSKKVAEVVYLKKEIKKFNEEIKKLRGDK